MNITWNTQTKNPTTKGAIIYLYNSYSSIESNITENVSELQYVLSN